MSYMSHPHSTAAFEPDSGTQATTEFAVQGHNPYDEQWTTKGLLEQPLTANS